MSNNRKTTVQKEPSGFMYKLNIDGTNEFSMQVVPGYNNNCQRLSDEQVAAISEKIHQAIKNIDFDSITNP